MQPTYKIYRAKKPTCNIKSEPELSELIKLVSDQTNTSIVDMYSKSRKSELAFSRFIYYYLAWKYTTATLKQIGFALKGTHHTCVIHGRDYIKDLYTFHNGQRAIVERVESEIKFKHKPIRP